MKTAKELAKKAFCDAVKLQNENQGYFEQFTPEERFEGWWREWSSSGEHKDSFFHELDVFIGPKRYIKAE